MTKVKEKTEMKNLEFLECKILNDKNVIIQYSKYETGQENEPKEMSLLLSIQDVIGLAYKVDLIDDWEISDTISDSIVKFDISIDPLGPEMEQEDYPFQLSLEKFLNDLSQNDFLKIIKYHEDIKEAEKMHIDEFWESIDTITKCTKPGAENFDRKERPHKNIIS